ncbi:membrane-bound serine protease (ClpP class) [Desulfitispora alkaliphila]|uniref:NfeD family protein n=1 Tax=Desulfitispora alkaliphila TaxID=622674 RepID=UPI003D194578
MLKRITTLILILLLMLSLVGVNSWAQNEQVYIIPVEGTIDGGEAAFFERAFNEAEAAGAQLVLVEINTPGGRLDSVMDMEQTMRRSDIPIAAFVTGGAISAGALIAFSAPDLYMAPGTTIGAAEARMGEERADEKTLSYWRESLGGAAERHGRDKLIAEAMVDVDIEIPGLIDAGKLLTMTANTALEWEMIDGIFDTREQVLAELGFEGAGVAEVEKGPAEHLASLVTNPFISPILLTLGFYGLLLELYSAGWGISGTIGLISLGLFFGGHLIAGFAGIESLILFLAGIILVLVEVFVTPGFGVAGIGGVIALIASIVTASISFNQAIISLAAMSFGTVLLFLLSFRFFKTRNFWKRVVLGDKMETDKGYVSADSSLVELLGKEGVTLTPLRPAGTIEIEDGRRVDVVTEGSFIGNNTDVKIVKVEGTRVIVRKVNKEQ